MPRFAEPPNMPDGVLAVIDAIGNPTRTELLRQLSIRPMTVPELAERIGVSSTQVLRHLDVLENLDLVMADHPRGSRRARGRVVLWESNRARVVEVGTAWIHYATAGPAPDD